MNNSVFQTIVKGIGRVADGNGKKSIITEVTKMKKSTMTTIMTAVVVTVMLAAGWARAGVIVTDYSNFEQNVYGGETLGFNSDPGSSDLVISGPEGDNSSINDYLSDEFPKYDTAGERLSIDLTDVSDMRDYNYSVVGLTVANATDAGQQNMLAFEMWERSGLDFRLTYYDSNGDDTKEWNFAQEDTIPDTLFMEKTATGWKAGSITGGTETVRTDTSSASFDGTTIDIDGSALGVNVIMKNNAQTYTMSDLTVIPEPSSLALLGLAGLLLMKRRRV